MTRAAIGIMSARWLRRVGHGVALLATGTLVLSAGGCADSLPSLPKITELNPFKEKQVPLPGRRIPVIQGQEQAVGELADATQPIVLPPPRENDSWAQPGGDANNAPGHLALASAVRQTWSADAGTGSSKAGRVTASPIVFDGKIFTLDAEGRVTAFSSSGSSLWRVSLVPEQEVAGGFLSFSSTAGGGYGGGLAADGGRIYAASGFGVVAALDPGSGKKIWEKNVGTPIRASPTAVGDRVFVVTLDGRFFCMSGVDGAELWSARGLPQEASLVLNVSPAVEGDMVVVPYPTGDLAALKVSDGSSMWSESLSRARASSQLAALNNASRPAISSGMVFAVGHSGRMVATQASSGERLWSLNLPGTQTPWVAGDSVFVVDTTGQLLAITRTGGKIQWTIKLPTAGPWSGPTLAGGNLWLTSAKGQLVGVDAASGRVTAQQDIGSPVFIPPVVAQGRMYILTDNAKLIALGG